MPLSMLLQTDGPADRTMIIVMGVIALVILVVLGLSFLRNLFEVITAPTASLKYHGQSDHFFRSLLIVFLSGLIATVIMLAGQTKIVDAYSVYSTHIATDLGEGNVNPNYKDIARDKAQRTLDSNFNIFFVQNMLILPMFFVGVWLVIGFLTFILSKIFNGGATAVDMLGTTAYSAFFMTIGFALATPFLIGQIAGAAGATAASPDPMGIIGAVLMLYGVVLYFLGVTHAAELSGGQTLGVVIFLLVLLGGLSYWGYDSSSKTFETFANGIRSFDPSKGST
jgi:hypothetical protein